MEGYKTKARPFAGSNWSEISRNARQCYKIIELNSGRRRTYVRSAYFYKQKIFLGLFWHHLHEKLNLQDKTRRLKFFPCAIELIQHSRIQPTIKNNPNSDYEILYRFCGVTPTNETFFVQIKENVRTKEKFLISIFPEKD